MMESELCQNCQNATLEVNFPCIVCHRLMAYYNCNNCNPNPLQMIDTCSPKCKTILDGKAHIVPIEYDKKVVMIIEDFEDIIGLKVVDHPLLYYILSPEQKDKLNNKCQNCHENNYTILPYKCWSCKDVYTYEIECSMCYNPNGYLCDECDFEINGDDV